MFIKFLFHIKLCIINILFILFIFLLEPFAITYFNDDIYFSNIILNFLKLHSFNIST